MFTSYARLCRVSSLHRLLCWLILINKNLCEMCSPFTLKSFQLNSFGEVCFLKDNYKYMQKIQIKKKKCNHILYEINEYAFDHLRNEIILSLKWYADWVNRFGKVVLSLIVVTKLFTSQWSHVGCIKCWLYISKL